MQTINSMTLMLLALNEIKGLGSKSIIEIVERYFLSNTSSYNETSFINYLAQKHSFGLEKIDLLNNQQLDIQFALAKNEMKDITIVSYFDTIYPYQLKLLKNPPLFLFCKGNTDLLSNDNCIAVVGTRENSKIGEMVAIKTAEFFAKNYTIVSGLAKGIDTYGHRGALNAKGKTIAVLTDLIKIYPAENRDLANEIIENNGLLFSEIAPWKSVYRSAFVDRDRLQSGMSLATFVIETDVIGGTMHTVKFTKEQNRLLFVPNYVLLKYEEGFSKINGTKHLLHTNQAKAYSKDTYDEILEQLQAKKNELQKIYFTKLQNEKGLL